MKIVFEPMDPIHIVALGGIAVLAIVCVVLGWLVRSQRHKLNAFIVARKQSILDDLELATGEQLLGELRKRSGTPYLMLSPIYSEDHQGLSIEVHNIQPIPCFHMLHMATNLTFLELKKRGVELPDFPGGPDGPDFSGGSDQDGEDWKKKD